MPRVSNNKALELFKRLFAFFQFFKEIDFDLFHTDYRFHVLSFIFHMKSMFSLVEN